MRAHVNAANSESRSFVNESKTLVDEKLETEKKRQILQAFNSHFTVDDSELTSLTSTAEPVDDRFFQILTRVKRIHSDSQVLLGGEDQKLGLEILEQSSKHLNAAYQKLYRSIQREFKTLDLENPQISVPIRRSLRVLAERPTLFQTCLDSFAESREHVLSDSFHMSLTGTSTSSQNVLSTKPIEFHAHDPIRYIGDMLAWAHSTTVSEREALEVLFVSEGDEIAKSIQAGLESEPWTRVEGKEQEVFDGKKALNELVTKDLTGVAKILRQRAEQVVASHEDPTLSYRIANLIGFYRTTFSKLLGQDSSLLDSLAALEDSALRQFRVNMRDHVASVQGDTATVSEDLSPPEFLLEALDDLKELTKSFDSSLTSAEDRDAAFQPILEEALDPFLDSCESMYKKLGPPRNDVFAINCLLETRSVLAKHSFTKQRISDIESTLEDHTSKLVSFQHQYLLRASGLSRLLDKLTELSDSREDILSIPTLAPFRTDALSAISQQLDEFLPSALMDAVENVKRLKSSRLAQKVTEDAAEQFCEDFEFVEEKIIAADELLEFEVQGEGDDGGDDNEEEGPVRLRSIFQRTSGEIRVLLS